MNVAVIIIYLHRPGVSVILTIPCCDISIIESWTEGKIRVGEAHLLFR